MEKRSCDVKKMRARILIRYSKPEYNEGVEFISTYYAEAEEEEDLREVFRRSFEKTHPGWRVLEVEVSEA